MEYPAVERTRARLDGWMSTTADRAEATGGLKSEILRRR
jgi:hypothetical protein